MKEVIELTPDEVTENETKVKGFDETMDSFERDLELFYGKVDNLSKKSAIRVLKAVMEWPLQSNTEVIHVNELEVYTLGVNITQAKINATIMQMVEAGQEKLNNDTINEKEEPVLETFTDDEQDVLEEF